MNSTTTSTTTNTTTTTTTTSTAPTFTTGPHRTQPAPSVNPHPRSESIPRRDIINDALNGLRADITALLVVTPPDLDQLLKIYQGLKNAEYYLDQAQHEGCTHALTLLVSELIKSFKKIDHCLATQFNSKTTIELSTIQTLCMGLSTLAHPLAVPLLNDEQRTASRPLLSTISIKLAEMLTTHIDRDTTAPGPLLNCLNWFSRALKADLLKKNQPAIETVFVTALHQIRQWSDSADRFDSHQLSKCMVQLNTMIKQRLINIDSGEAFGQANRVAWTKTVSNLCNHYLAHDNWIKECNLVELINVANTLKDGLDQGLLSSSDQSLALVFNILAQRISAQEFDLCNASSLTAVGNCANFLRSLFEHGLLGTTDSVTGKAILHLVNALCQTSLRDALTGGNAQALVNLASFIKATDRWLATQPKLAKVGSHATLANATMRLIHALSDICENPNQRWMRSPRTCSALLAALQHLWQRGLVQAQQRNLLRPILMRLLQSIPKGEHTDRNSKSTLLSLRALVAMTNKGSPVADLQNTPAFAEALTTLLVQLQQSKLADYTAEERLHSLQAVQIGIALGAVSLAAFQPLLRSLLQTKDEVDLLQLETAINNFGGLVTQLEALSAEALSQIPAITHTTSLKAKQTKPRGETYRGQMHEPTKRERIADAPPIFGSYDWKTVDKGNKSPLFLEEPPLPLPFTAAPSSSPKVVVRSPEQITAAQNKGNKQKEKTTEIKKTTLMTSLQPARVEKAQPAQIKQTNEVHTLKEAQAKWFNLLEELKSASLDELKKLALTYPQLLNMKAPGKQGQVALFYALTQGKREIVEWLMQQDVHKLENSLGKFLIGASNAIPIIEKRHISALRALIDTYLKLFEKQIQAVHAQEQPGGQPLNKQEFIARKNILFSKEEKESLREFAILQPLFDEYKLITKEELTAASKNKVANTAKTLSTSEFKKVQLKFLTAVVSGDLNKFNKVRQEIEKKMPGMVNQIIHTPGAHEMSVLMTAVYDGHTEIVTELLRIADDKEALLQMKSIDGTTALMLAAGQGHTKIMIELLHAVKNKNAMIKMEAENGVTALIAAASKGHTEIVNMLLEEVDNKDALAQVKQRNGMTALIMAAYQNYTETVATLLKDINDKDKLLQMQADEGWSALTFAAKHNHTAMATVLLDSANDKDALQKIKTINGATALMIASISGNIPIINFLMSAAKNKDEIIQQKSNDGSTALIYALQAGNTEAAITILNAANDKGSLVRQQNQEKFSALMLAAELGYRPIVNAILQSVNDKDELAQMQNNHGMNALMLATKKGHVETVKLLLDSVKDKETLLQMQNNDGLTALNIAAFINYNFDLVGLLMEAAKKG